MPFHAAGATRMLDALLTGDIYAHLHSADPPSITNSVSGTGYAPVRVAASTDTLSTIWNSSIVGSIRRRTNRRAIHFPTPGGDWTRAVSVALWDRASLAANPADPPELLRSAQISVIDAALNDAVTIPAGGIVIDIEVL